MTRCRVCKGTFIESYRGHGPGGWAKRDCQACFVGPPAPRMHPLAPWYAPTRYLPVTIFRSGEHLHGVVDLWTSEWFNAEGLEDARDSALRREAAR